MAKEEIKTFNALCFLNHQHSDKICLGQLSLFDPLVSPVNRFSIVNIKFRVILFLIYKGYNIVTFLKENLICETYKLAKMKKTY